MDDGGVHQALVIPGHGYLRPNGIADTRRVNDEIAAYRDATPERFPVACGIVEPRDGAAAFEEIDRAAGELGLVALSFHTRFQGVSMDSQWILRYLERMGEVGLVPLMHAMDDTPEESLWKLASIARQLPDLTMLAARRLRRLRGHAPVLLRRRGRAERRVRHQPELQLRLHRRLRGAVRRRRVSCSAPISTRIPSAGASATCCRRSSSRRCPHDDKAAILGGNARRLLGI